MTGLKTIKASLLTLAAATMLTGGAFGATLKSDVIVYSNVVLAKDLFDDLKDHGDQPLFLSPDLGTSGTISAHRVANEAYDIGIYDIQLNGVEKVTVHRPSQKLTRTAVLDALTEEVREHLGAHVDFELKTNSLPAVIHADPRTAMPITFNDVTFQNNKTRMRAVATVKTPQGERIFAINGTIEQMKEVITLTRDVPKDYVLQAGDFEKRRVARRTVQSGAVFSAAGLIGKATTKSLNASDVLKNSDIAEPILVRSNDLVSINYRIPGLLLTAQGRALNAGAEDTMISVMNLQSKRVVRARIAARGEVVVEQRKPLVAKNTISNSEKVKAQ